MTSDAISQIIANPDKQLPDANEVLYQLFQSDVSMPQIVEAARGLTDVIHRNPVVHGNPNIERLCTELYNDLTKAIESATRLEQAIYDELKADYL